MAIAASLFLTFTALIYNLIADIVGGVEVVLAEKRDLRARRFDTLRRPLSTLASPHRGL